MSLDVHVVLTMRGIASSKSRLARALCDAERSDLNRWLLDRTLRVVDQWLGGLERCIFVSACATALRTAAEAGAIALSEPGGAGGHNHAAAAGAAHAVSVGAVKVMLLPCDLPDLAASALHDFEAQSARAELVLAPDKDGTGTNALIVEAAPDLRFFFGDDSRARYCAWGASRGWRIAVHETPALAFDLDTPADYDTWYPRSEYALHRRRQGRFDAMV
jgi:2-phospho-L-lactate/phosphoenolpyruvate guanylyltransferase